MGEGNYTQQDVMEAARGLTGYQTDGLNVYFNPNRFDDGQKTFLGQTGNFDANDNLVGENNVIGTTLKFINGAVSIEFTGVNSVIKTYCRSRCS